MKNSFILILIAIIFSACVDSKQELNFEKPEVQIPKKAPEPRKNKGSLYSMQGTSLFADKKDLNQKQFEYALKWLTKAREEVEKSNDLSMLNKLEGNIDKFISVWSN